jgi:hypothetical protein
MFLQRQKTNPAHAPGSRDVDCAFERARTNNVMQSALLCSLNSGGAGMLQRCYARAMTDRFPTVSVVIPVTTDSMPPDAIRRPRTDASSTRCIVVDMDQPIGRAGLRLNSVRT